MNLISFNLEICKIIFCLSLTQFKNIKLCFKCFEHNFGESYDDFIRVVNETYKKGLLFEISFGQNISVLHLTREGFKLGEQLFKSGLFAGVDVDSFKTIYKNKRSCLRYLYDLWDCYRLPNFVSDIYDEIKDLNSIELNDFLNYDEIKKLNIFYQRDNGEVFQELSNTNETEIASGLYYFDFKIKNMINKEGYNLCETPTIFHDIRSNRNINVRKTLEVNKMFQSICGSKKNKNLIRSKEPQFNFINRQIFLYYSLKKNYDIIYIVLMIVFDSDGDLINIFVTRDLNFAINKYQKTF